MRRLLLPLLFALLPSCRDGGTALSVTVKLKGPAACVRVTAAGGGGQALASDIPVEADADFRTRTLSAAIYPGGPLGTGAVSLAAQGFPGACGAAPATQEVRRTATFVEGQVTPVLLELQLLGTDSDGDGSPDAQDCAPEDAARYPRTGAESGPACGNGLDDDCDGAADDGCPCTSPRPCYPASLNAYEGVGACTRGTQPCTGGTYGECADYVLPADESCDGTDDDCDGTVDEDCPCQEAATRPCYEAGPAELAGKGACATGTQTCASNAWGECTGDVGPTAETCNAKDDDCDGAVDELPDVPTAPCALQQGVCAGSRLQCGQQACTQAEYAAAAAVLDAGYVPQEGAAQCDGLDNDCDGTLDEGCPCAAGATEPCHPLGLAFGGLGRGNCKAGTRSCQQDGGWGECTGAVSPTPELCNGLDDDCDGAEDDDPADAGQPCASGSKGVCAAGKFLCSNGGLLCAPDNAPSPETCDAEDDDCDGSVDEDFPGLGQSCNPGLGACARAGTLQCLPDGGAGCSVDAGLPSAERCNGVDDDCDGQADEDFPSLGTLCSASFGACVNNGTYTCLADGGSGCSAAAPVPAPEACNGVDDDCDGQKDNGFPGLGQACDNGQAGACAALGNITCLPDGAAGCSAPTVTPGTETCNALDDDCDGTADDGFNLGQPCSVGVGACARSGTLACKQDGTAGCNAPVVSGTAETCNGADDDCNGVVDDGFNVGQTCTVGTGVCAKTGTWACNAQGGATCIAPGGAAVTPGPASRELCDGKDNDCDGATDEWPECGGPRADVAENAAGAWRVGRSTGNTVAPCGIGLGTGYTLTVNTATAAGNVLAGSSSARIDFDGRAFFFGGYPSTLTGNWDLSSTQGLHYRAKVVFPAGLGVYWDGVAPVVVLCGTGGTYRVLTPQVSNLPADAWSGSVYVPLAGGGGWTSQETPGFNPQTVNGVEFHMNPYRTTDGAATMVWFDDVRFY